MMQHKIQFIQIYFMERMMMMIDDGEIVLYNIISIISFSASKH